jgi:DNA-directed RNA polymerase specialized sigma54-like protein
MAKQSIRQGQKQTQKQRLTPLQLLIGQMIEKPVDQLQEYVSHQLIDNPALEASPGEESSWETPSVSDRESPSPSED